MKPEDTQNYIRDLMTKNDDMTCYRLAKLAGVPQSTITDIFGRDSYPKIETMIKICGVFDISFGDFYSFDITPSEEMAVTGRNVRLLKYAQLLNDKNFEKLMIYVQALTDAQEEDWSNRTV
ncbi:DNA-binding transcriptional regulator, XRE-family HTH domain [Butyrivibrio sp. ob235]|uniref:helix-turn-helix transcriptional regulator n=1 Tax=Butyrivibrio sp. ob235 TaxID=1761780 RepID=UPI0008D8AFD1|nr:helix-turn-helix transcriptional regulator [Butyrivibrio sp. ob235]SEM38728.1 DNA-binding transcriptional regulator, XRE-family HTH domain [Butyrivibrio sp. ob235]